MANIGMQNIIQSWSALLPGQANKLDKYFELAEGEFKKRKTGLEFNYENIGALLGRKREFLKINYNKNWCCYIGAEDLGTDLVVTWDLYSRNPLQGQQVIGLFKSDFIEINSIKTFSSVTCDCAISAAETMMDEGKLDKKRLNRQSSGALGPL